MTDVDDRLLLPKGLTARVLGISVQAFSQWGLQPHERKGREALYLLPEVIAEARRRWEKTEGEAGGGLNLFEEQARLAKEKADSAALDNATRRGELADLGDISDALGQALAAFRSRMLAASSKLAPLVNPGNPNLARDVIEREHNDILAELAAFDPGAEQTERPEDAPLTADNPATAAVADGERVGRRQSTAKQRGKRRARPVAN